MNKANIPSELSNYSIEVFASYSHKDQQLHDELARHLMPLVHEGLIQPWHDRKIAAGSEFDGAIDAVLNRAAIILLLVSPDFVASTYCWGIEMLRAMERHNSGEARVIPIILRPVDWRRSQFGKLLALPTDGRPVTSWPNRDEAFLEIARGIRAAIEQTEVSSDHLNKHSPPPPGFRRTDLPAKSGEQVHAGPRALDQRRISACGTLWSAALALKEGCSASTFFFTILDPLEYDLAFSGHPYSRSLVASVTHRTVTECLKLASPVEEERPYVGEKLWGEFLAYRAFLGRLAYLIVMGKERRHIDDWRSDNGIRQILSSVLPDVVVESLLANPWNPHAVNIALGTLESRILAEIRKVTSLADN